MEKMSGIETTKLGLPSLDGLEEWERRKIMCVLQRDVDIQKQKDFQIRRLRSDIERLSEKVDENTSDKCCVRCRSSFGLLINSGAACPKCRFRVCVGCRVQNDGHKLGWICVLCDKTQQYAVLTGEWILPNTAQRKPSRNITKSASASVLRILNPNRENDYYPGAAAVANKAMPESSISEALLRHLKEESMQSWKPVDTGGVPPNVAPPVPAKRNKDKKASGAPVESARRRSPSLGVSPVPARKSSWRCSANVGTASSKGGSALLDNSVSGVGLPVLRVEHVEDDGSKAMSARNSYREDKNGKSFLNAFNRGFRCPSVPNQLDRLIDNHDGQLSSLLSVHNVRVSIRSTSSDNISNSAASGRFSVLEQDKRRYECDTQRAIKCDLFGDRKSVVSSAVPMRKASQTSCATMDDVAELWDDNLSSSSDCESVISLASCSVASSIRKLSVSREKKESCGSLNSGYSTKITVQGAILLSCNYNCVEGSLEVHIIKCRDLYPMSARKNRANPYVKMYLLPDTSPMGKRKTRVKRRTVNPEFNEILKVRSLGCRLAEALQFTGLTKSELEARTLLITVWHYDVLGRSHFMGEVRLKMSDYPWIPGETYWINLEPHVSDCELENEVIPADIMVSVKFSFSDLGKGTPLSEGTLHCVVRCPQNLPTSRVATGATCYIKCYLYPDRRKSTKQKSPLVKLGADPTWKHTFVYNNLSLNDLEERCLELTAWAHQRVGANEFLGGIRLNFGTGFSEGDKVDWMDSTAEEAAVWKEVLAKPNSWVDAAILLRMDMESKL